MNVCTYGYSLAFVPWSYWERHIDWMALQGINLPLMFVGQELLWIRTFERFNVTHTEQVGFYSGAAFLPWFRMGNMQGFGGPLTDRWVHQRHALGKQILTRMRSLGMTPALSAFAGHVPDAFVSRYPHAKAVRSADWVDFPPPYGRVWLLDPSDPLFVEIGRTFIQLQIEAYGTDHIYQADTYNEMSPPSSDPDYLRASSGAVSAAMAAADPKAVWLMQGWLFQSAWWQPTQIEAYLSGVSRGRLWLLDLYADSNAFWNKTTSFYGHPFIFCTLLNFGGQQGIVGNLPQIVDGMQGALRGSTISGVGITMEGIWNNYNVFEMQLLLGWDAPRAPPAQFNASLYMASFGARRYGGIAHPKAISAWQHLGATVYSGKGGEFGSAISTVPTLNGSKCRHPVEVNRHPEAKSSLASLTSVPILGAASPQESRPKEDGGSAQDVRHTFQRAWRLLIEAAPSHDQVASYRFDLVDVGREVIAANFSALWSEYNLAFVHKDKVRTDALGAHLLHTIDDYELLLGSDSNFLLGRWLSWATAWGEDDIEKARLEYGARNQLTLWGPTGQINDYAKKEWSGLVKTYYKPRWAKLISSAQAYLAEEASRPWYLSMEQYCRDVWENVELPWQHDRTAFPTKPSGDPLFLSRRLWEKYREV